MSETISPNTTLAHYTILSKIGEGGMGEVYRARDTKLGRDVAIKVLPASLSENADRLNRFEQEAQAAGALNHPNILSIYHIGTHDGAPYIVSELLEGETLRERMAGGALPPRKATDYALQIARGLAAAHEKGIVHRDIKPDNIFITDDGRVKILDFGLAKLLPRRGYGASGGVGEEDPTIARPVSPSPNRPVNTDPGTVMGTMGYMSPEQLKGKQVDHRSDIFSFGAILYEMLSGKRAFRGDSMAETMSAILREDPPDLSETNKTISPALERVVRHCLEKNPAERFHSARDLGFALESISGAATSSGGTTDLSVLPASWQAKHKIFGNARIWMGTTALLAVALIGLGILFISKKSSKTESSAVVRYDVLPPSKSGINLLRTPAVAFSPDGSTLAILATTDGVNHLYIRRRDDPEIRMVPGTEGALDAAFSPDGQWIAFIADFTLKKVPLSGPPVSLAKVGDTRGLAWMDMDTLVYTPDATGGVFQISANGGTPKAITTIDEKKKERTHRWPQMLPGGKALIFTVGSIDKPDDYDDSSIEAIIIGTGERRLILQGASMARYIPTGHLLFGREGTVYAVAFDPNSLMVQGKPVAILSGVAGDKTTGAIHFSVADDGTLAYVPGSATAGNRSMVWVDKQGNQSPINIPAAQLNDPRISPDGRHLALLQGSSGSGDVWIYEFERTTFTRLTFTTTNATPVWSADGKYIYYASVKPISTGDETTVLRRPADGSREAESLLTLSGRHYIKGILPDGETVVFDSNLQTVNGAINKVLLKAGSQIVPVLSHTFNERAAALSPDGRWLAYQSNESGRPEIYVRDLSEAGGRWPISTAGGQEPRWSADGRELYYRNNGVMMVAPIDTHAGFQAGTPKTLFNEVYDLRSNSGETYDVDPRSGRFLLIRPTKEDLSSAQVRIVLNWFSELRKLAPAN